MQALKRELKKLTGLFFFFLIGFGYILLVMKLLLREYSIDTYVLSKAIIGALIAAKSVAIMDVTPLFNRFEHLPRYINILRPQCSSSEVSNIFSMLPARKRGLALRSPAF
jgi:putative effector of murein hydrolase